MREHPAGSLGRYALLGATVLGTMANNVINVPLRDIADDLGAPVGESVLAVSAFIIVLAVAIPITGWVGDRYGRRRILIGALALMVVGQLLAAAATSLPFLIGARAVQGLACSAIPPMVMGMLVTFFPAERLRMMGAWAAANGVGQAIGPPVGGFVASLWGWRAIFLIIGAASVVTLLVVARSIPQSIRRAARVSPARRRRASMRPPSNATTSPWRPISRRPTRSPPGGRTSRSTGRRTSTSSAATSCGSSC